MKKLVLLTAFLSQILFAQQNDLAIDLQPVSGSNINWETTLTLDAQSGMENGLLIELPAGIKMVPVIARINADDMYLQNKSETPSIEKLICWDLTAEGVVLYFQDGQFNSGDRLVIKTMTSQIKKQAAENPTINIRTIVNRDQELQFSADIKTSSIMQLKIEN
jgi:hypothetical protein